MTLPLFTRSSTEVSVDAHLAQSLAALDAATAGHPRELAVLLADLRRAHRWDDRDHLLRHAALRAVRDSRWLTAWRAGEPTNPDVLRLLADVAVTTSWSHRAGNLLERVTMHRTLTLAESLAEAAPLVEGAVRACPEDPGAWATVFDMLRGDESPAEEAEEYAAAAATRFPTAFGWRRARLHYLAARGRSEDAWEFACDAAVAAPTSRLLVLPLLAAIHALHQQYSGVDRANLVEATPIALDYVEQADGPEQVVVANLLAAKLTYAGLTREAKPFLRLIEGRVDSLAWADFDVDAQTAYTEAMGEGVLRKGLRSAVDLLG